MTSSKRFSILAALALAQLTACVMDGTLDPDADRPGAGQLGADATDGEAADDDVVPQREWRLLFVSSEELQRANRAGVNAFDGDPSTHWHTEFVDRVPPPPHEIQIDLRAEHELSAFQYLPRQDGNAYSRVGAYAFHVSDDPSNWGPPVAEGVFPNSGAEQVVSFAAPARGRFIRFVALEEVSGNPSISVANLDVTGRRIGDLLDPPTPAARFCETITPTKHATPSTWTSVLAGAQPGDVIEFAAGLYHTGSATTWTLNGTADSPIVLCGAGTRAAHLTNSQANGGFVLRLRNSSHVTLANFRISHPDQTGIDGRTTRSCSPNSNNPSCLNKNEEGVIVVDSHHISFKENLFHDIGTRGILVANGSAFTTIEHNLFVDIGNNISSAAINVNGGTAQVRGNLLSGNVDGLVTHGAPHVGFVVERNICVWSWQENCFDFKAHHTRNDPSDVSVVRHNVVHGNRLTRQNTIHLSNGTRWIEFRDNWIGTPGEREFGFGIRFLGRDGLVGDALVQGNCIVGANAGSGGVISILQGSEVRNVEVRDNHFVDIEQPLQGPGLVDGGNNVAASQCPPALTALERSIQRELERYFSTSEIAMAYEGSGVPYTP